MKRLLFVYRLFNVLSLDIAFGAVCMAYFMTIVLEVQASPIYFFLLGLGVWTVYLIDHLYDSYKKESGSYRRIFYKKYANVLLYLLIFNIVSGMALFMVFMNYQVLKWSIPAAGITSIYLLTNWHYQHTKRRFYLKEIFISLGYTWGIMVVPLSFVPSFSPQLWLLGALIFCMAMWNVLVIAVFEKKLNDTEGQTTISQWMSITKIKLITTIVYMFFFGLMILNYTLFSIPPYRMAIWLCIGIYMAAPFLMPGFIEVKERYRWLAEQVFLVPAFFLFGYLISIS